MPHILASHHYDYTKEYKSIILMTLVKSWPLIMGYDSVTFNLLKIYIRFPKRLSSFLLTAYWLSRETFPPSCIFSKDYLGVKDDLLLEKFYFSVRFLTCSTSYSSLRILAPENFNFFFPSSFYRFLIVFKLSDMPFDSYKHGCFLSLSQLRWLVGTFSDFG